MKKILPTDVQLILSRHDCLRLKSEMEFAFIEGGDVGGNSGYSGEEIKTLFPLMWEIFNTL